MKENMFCSLVIFTNLMFFTASPVTSACTAFQLTRSGQVLVAKNLDWRIEAGYLIVQPRGIHRQALVPASQPVAEWTAQYGTVTACQFGRDFPLSGMNEAGLVVIELSLSISRYPRPDHRPAVNEFQWIQYMLDTCSTTDQVIESASRLRIEPALFALHYFITDRSGNAAVIQFLDGHMVVRTGTELPVPVLTNNRYDNMTRYLKHYEGFGGDRIPLKSSASPERFVRTARLLQLGPENGETPIQQAVRIQDSAAQHDTVWQLLYEPTALQVHVRTRRNPTQRTLAFQQEWFEPDQPCRMLDLGAPGPLWEGHSDLPQWSLAANRAWIQLVFEKLRAGDRNDPTRFMNLEAWVRYPLEHTNHANP